MKNTVYLYLFRVSLVSRPRSSTEAWAEGDQDLNLLEPDLDLEPSFLMIFTHVPEFRSKVSNLEKPNVWADVKVFGGKSREGTDLYARPLPA